MVASEPAWIWNGGHGMNRQGREASLVSGDGALQSGSGVTVLQNVGEDSVVALVRPSGRCKPPRRRPARCKPRAPRESGGISPVGDTDRIRHLSLNNQRADPPSRELTDSRLGSYDTPQPAAAGSSYWQQVLRPALSWPDARPAVPRRPGTRC